MQKESFYSNHLKCVVERIDKRTARKLYNAGKTIYLQGCTMRFDNMWQSACPISKDREQWEGQNFDSTVNEYTYYNCDSERGRYVHFYVREKDLNVELK